MSSYDSLRNSSPLFSSDILEIATSEIEVESAKYYGHHFVGVEFFSDSSGTPAVPSAGTYLITVEMRELQGVFQSPANNSVTAATPVSVNFSGAPTKIQFEPDSIADATHFRLNLNSNRT